MNKQYHFILVFGTSLLISIQLNAQTLSFPQVWEKIKNESAALKASALSSEASEVSENRVSRHWLPKVYLDVKSYQTNEPGASFFGLLQQRRLQNSDFNADLINHPGTSTFTRGALGLDLPLYEGGSKLAQSAVYGHQAAAQKNQESQTHIEYFTQAGQIYMNLVILKRQNEKLEKLSLEISKMIKGYRLGSKSNPVGYSGLLGMQSLTNRIQGYLNHYDVQKKSYYAAIQSMGLSIENWSPSDIDSEQFIVKYLKPIEIINDEESYQLKAAKESSLAIKEMTLMERARYLPRIGAFAETYKFQGDRNQDDGNTIGLYLQWNLFDSSDYGRLHEAKLKASANQYSFESFRQQEISEKTVHIESLKTMRANYALLNESDKLLSEQINMTSTLFRNGSISALQMVEVMNRRTDLIEQQTNTEMQLIKSAVELLRRQPVNIDQILNSRGGK